MFELLIRSPTEETSRAPRAGSPRSGLAIVKPEISVSRPGTLNRPTAATVVLVAPATPADGARMIVVRGCPEPGSRPCSTGRPRRA